MSKKIQAARSTVPKARGKKSSFSDQAGAVCRAAVQIAAVCVLQHDLCSQMPQETQQHLSYTDHQKAQARSLYNQAARDLCLGKLSSWFTAPAKAQCKHSTGNIYHCRQQRVSASDHAWPAAFLQRRCYQIQVYDAPVLYHWHFSPSGTASLSSH